MRTRKMSLLFWLRYKAWFIFDLPYFVKQNNFTYGVELGAKAGRSMFYVLRANVQLTLIGIDKWQIIAGNAYKHNDINEKKCRKRLKRFSNRAQLIKGEALTIADIIADASLDFVYYDLQSQPMKDKHEEMIKKWIQKIRDGGMLIGRDFRDFRQAFYNIGIQEHQIQPCKIGKRTSERLEYIYIDQSVR